jgi:hypothetical protein
MNSEPDFLLPMKKKVDEETVNRSSKVMLSLFLMWLWPRFWRFIQDLRVNPFKWDSADSKGTSVYFALKIKFAPVKLAAVIDCFIGVRSSVKRRTWIFLGRLRIKYVPTVRKKNPKFPKFPHSHNALFFSMYVCWTLIHLALAKRSSCPPPEQKVPGSNPARVCFLGCLYLFSKLVIVWIW